MRILSVSVAILALTGLVVAQSPPQVHGTLNQLMRGALYPTSNVLFNASVDDPQAADTAGFDPYGGWVGVESAAIAVAEAANLLTIPGRMCANGRPVPVDQEDWKQWVVGLRAAGMAAYQAAQSKSVDAMLAVSDQLVEACGNCHERYRDVGDDPARRCVP